MSISTYNASGGADYSTLSGWFAAKKSTAETHELLIENGSHDDAGYTFNDGSAVGDFVIKPETTRHDGRPYDVSALGAQLNITGGRLVWWFNSGAASLTIEGGLTLKGSATDMMRTDGSGNNTTIRDAIIFNPGGKGLDYRGSGTGHLAENVVISGAGSSSIDMRGSGSPTVTLIGCLALNGASYGILGGSDVKNCLSFGHGSADYFATGNHSYCISGDGTAAGTGSVANAELRQSGDTPTGDYVAFENLGVGTEDFRFVDLAHGSYTQLAIDTATSVAGWTSDFLGNARTGGSEDIGPHELTVGGEEHSGDGAIGQLANGAVDGAKAAGANVAASATPLAQTTTHKGGLATAAAGHTSAGSVSGIKGAAGALLAALAASGAAAGRKGALAAAAIATATSGAIEAGRGFVASLAIAQSIGGAASGRKDAVAAASARARPETVTAAVKAVSAVAALLTRAWGALTGRKEATADAGIDAGAAIVVTGGKSGEPLSVTAAADVVLIATAAAEIPLTAAGSAELVLAGTAATDIELEEAA